METNEFDNYDALVEAAKRAGIKKERLDEAVETHSLPAEGEVAKVTLVEGTMPHIRIECTDGSIMSISRLTASPSLATKASQVEAVQQTKNPEKDSYQKFFLSGTRINPQLPSDQAKCAINLLGKKFKAEKFTAFVLPYETTGKDDEKKPVFCNSLAEVRAKVKPKDFYTLTVL